MRFHLIAASVIGLGVWSLGASLQAEPIIEETFMGYQDNVLLSASPAGAAIGLAGDWALAPNQDFYVNRTQTDLDAGTGRAVYDRELDYNGARTATRNTSADHVLFENDGDVFYASFLIDPGRADGHMTFELELEKLDGGGVQDFVFGITEGKYTMGNGGINVNVSGGTVTTDEQLVLVRVAYGAADSGPDTDEVVTLWVDPVDESSTPVIDGVSTAMLNRGGGRITAVSMRGDQMEGSPAFFDNLRVGSSFAAVFPEPYSLTWDNEGGIGDDNWVTAANWDPDQTPDANADTILANGDMVFLRTPVQEARTVAIDNGTLNIVFGGQLTVAENVNVAAGSRLRVDGTLAAAGTHVEGTLSGLGTVAATVTVAAGGIVAAGGSIGTLTTSNVTFEPGSTLFTELSSPASEGMNDRLDVIGDMDLGAADDTLALGWLPDGHSSKFGGDYIVATYGSRVGEFDTVGGGGAPYSIGAAYVAGVDYVTDDRITISLHSLLDGDADLDGDVDFGDYLTLEAAFGGEGEWKDGDFDLSGTVDFGDYLILEASFGDSVPAESAAAVPEPATLTMLLGGFAGLLAYARRKR